MPAVTALSLDELQELEQRSECVACGRPDARPAKIPLAAGASVADLDEYLPDVTLCAECGAKLASLPRRTRFRAFLAMAGAMVSAVVVSVFLPLSSPIAPVIAAAIGAAIGFYLFKRVRQRAAAAAPLLILGAAGRIISFRRSTLAPELDDGGAGPYRSSLPEGPPHQAGTSGVSAVPALAAGSSSLLLGLIIGTAGAVYIGTQGYPEVQLDNPSRATYAVVVDGGTRQVVDPESRITLRLRHGSHRFIITDAENGELETVGGYLPWGRRHLLAVPEASCYTLSYTTWRWHGRTKRDVHAVDRGDDCGRWLAID